MVTDIDNPPPAAEHSRSFSMKTLFYAMLYGCLAFGVWGKYREEFHSGLVIFFVFSNFGAVLGFMLGFKNLWWFIYSYIMIGAYLISFIYVVSFEPSEEFGFLLIILLLLICAPLASLFILINKRKSREAQKILSAIMVSGSLTFLCYLIYQIPYISEGDNELWIIPFFCIFGACSLFGLVYAGFAMLLHSMLMGQDTDLSGPEKYNHMNRAAYLAGLLWLLIILFFDFLLDLVF